MNEEVSKLVSIGKINAAAGEKISALEPGVPCLHKSWGVGRVAAWDLLGDRMTIDFEDKPGHAMKLEFAAKSLEPLSEDHVLAKRLSDPEALTQSALDDPAGFAKLVLTSFGGTMMLDDWEDVVKGKVIPEGKYRSWWDNAKKAMRKNRQFVVPSKRNLPLELRADDVSPAEALMEEFDAGRDGKSKLKVLNEILKDLGTFDGSEELLQRVVDDVNISARQSQRTIPLVTIELILSRDELIGKIDGLEGGEGATLVDVLRAEEARLDEILRGMGTTRQREVYKMFPEAFGEEEWADKATLLLQSVGPRAIGELTKYLIEAGKSENLNGFLRNGLQQRSLESDVLAWVCKERKKAASEVFGPEIGSAAINSLERDHYEEASAAKSNRLHDILMDDKELMSDLLAEADRNQVRNFARRLKASPVFEDLNRGSLLARVIKLFPEVHDLVTGDEEEHIERQEGLIVSWESLEDRKATLENLIKKEIPENTREIAIAREHGDLRENFEFKAAKEMQAVLMRRQAELEVEIAQARGTDFKETDTSIVSIGTIVDLEDLGTGESETFTILGAWDTDLDKGIISYLSETGAALLGNSVGEEVEVGSEKEGETRSVRITAIRAYAA